MIQAIAHEKDKMAEIVKESVVTRDCGGGQESIGRTERNFRAVNNNNECMPACLSKLIKCITPRVNPNTNYGLQEIIKHQ